MKAGILLANVRLTDQRKRAQLQEFIESIDEDGLLEEDLPWLRLAVAAYCELAEEESAAVG